MWYTLLFFTLLLDSIAPWPMSLINSSEFTTKPSEFKQHPFKESAIGTPTFVVSTT
uniref:SJCHGC08937 protein n=1 Tax=Schistosoma japonicum TaxID=6182 RepID=Q5BR94_SCHJA|nr:SJCHGC08937 protein [Schistosoma japonicum]